MKKNHLLVAIDGIAAAVFLVCFVTGVMKIPKIAIIARIPFFTSPEVTFVHDVSGILLGVLIVIHLVMHRHWIKTMISRLLPTGNG